MAIQSDLDAPDAPTILERIVATKRAEALRLETRTGELAEAARLAPPPRDFRGALAREGTVALIAEIKRRSPGAGDIRANLDPATQARAYAAGGAAAVSVLTDARYFSGSLDDLAAVRRAVDLPVLRKDFVIDGVQLLEARAAGADAVLLIVRILNDSSLAMLHGMATDLGMAALVEVHDGGELERAIHAGARIVGINNRDLRTFETSLDVTLGLVDRVPESVLVVSESGVAGGDDVARLGRVGVDAVLVGEWLVRQPDAAAAAATLASTMRGSRHGG